MIKHILFPYDFSNQCVLTAPFVRAVMTQTGADLTVLAAIPPVFNTPSAEIPFLVEEEAAAQEHDLRRRLEREFDFAKNREVVLGDPALKIVEYAHAKAADLIMMPTHGMGIFRSMLVGSVTAKVLHDADCPVWTATHAKEQCSPAVPRTILCAIDGTPGRTVALVEWATGFSKAMGAHLKLLHVVPPISDWLAIPSEREIQEQLRAEARAQLDAQLKKAAGVDAPLRVAVGKITETVTEEARQEGADLIILGRGARQATMGRLRSHTYGVIQQSPCPVISV